MFPLRFASLSVVVTAATCVSLISFAGCGGSNSGGGAKNPTPSGGSEAASSTGSGATDAGPTTTTTITLSDGGDLQGTKLSSSSSSTVETAIDGGPRGPHQQEPGRSVKDIQAIIVSRRDEARACYDAALKTHPGIEGDLDIQWVIDPKGTVSDISVDTSRSQILEPSVHACIMNIIKRIHFNESAKGFETRAHYPFNFHPRSGGVMVVR
jgi:hypothetical protein